MTILHINTAKSYRGGEVQTLLLARELNARGHKNIVLCRPDSAIQHHANRFDVQTLPVQMRGEWDVSAAQSIRRIADDAAASVIHAHTPHAATLALLSNVRRTRPIVWSRRIGRPPSQNLFAKIKIGAIDAVLAVSQSVANVMVSSGLNTSKVFVAYSATDFTRFDSLPDRLIARKAIGLRPEVFVIGNVSHFDTYKGQQSLIQVFADVRSEMNNAVLLLVGSGAELNACQEAVKKWNLGDRVIFAGEQVDVGTYYACFDLFFFASSPSVPEGLPGALREAMGCGIAAIAVDQPAVRELVGSEQAALLVPASDLTAWGNALLTLYADTELRSKLAVSASRAARRFTVTTMADQTEQCYAEVLRRRTK